MFSYAYRRADCFPNRRGLGAAPPVTNGLLNNIKAYWSFNLTGGFEGVPDFGTVSLYAVAPATTTASGLISNAITCSPWGDTVACYFPISNLSTLVFNQDVSISVWAKPNTSSNNYDFGTLFQLTNSSGDSLLLAFEDNQIHFGGFVNGGNESFNYIPPSGWTAGDWIHIVLLKDVYLMPI